MFYAKVISDSSLLQRAVVHKNVTFCSTINSLFIKMQFKKYCKLLLTFEMACRILHKSDVLRRQLHFLVTGALHNLLPEIMAQVWVKKKRNDNTKIVAVLAMFMNAYSSC